MLVTLGTEKVKKRFQNLSDVLPCMLILELQVQTLIRHQFKKTVTDKCNLQAWLLFSTSETIATLVNYTCQ